MTEFDFTMAMAARLEDESAFDVVDVALLFAARRRLPGQKVAMLAPVATTAGAHAAPGAGGIQRFVANVGVLLITPAPNDLTGSNALAALRDMVSASREKLLGWTPPGAETGLEFARGALIDAVDGAAAWQDEYALRFWRRGADHRLEGQT